MSWFYLALLAPLLFAIVNLLDDNLLRFVYKSPYLATVFTGFFGVLPLLAVSIKIPHITLSLALLSLLAGFLTVTYYLFYFKGLESDSPAIVVALFSLAPATIPFFAHYLVNENLQSLQIVGFAIVLFASLGLATVNLKKLQFSKALFPVVIAVVFMDAVSIITKYVYQEIDFYSAYMYFCGGMGIGGIFFLLLKLQENIAGLREIRKILRRVLPIFVIAECINLAAEFTLNLAISRGPVSLIKVIEGIQPMFVLLIALLLYPFAPHLFKDAGDGKAFKKFVLMTITIVGLAIISITA